MIREEYERIIIGEIHKRTSQEESGMALLKERDQALEQVEKLKT